MDMKVAIQLYSVRQSMEKDPIGTIQKVLDSGYRYIEAANHNALEDAGLGFGVGAKELKALLDAAGAKIVSAHIYPFDEEKYKEVMEYNLTIGNTNIVYPMDNFKDLDDVLRRCEMLNHFGALSRKNGLNFLYHNHSHEFMTIDGKTVMDIIMDNVAPENLGLELDTFWAMRAGMDNVELLRKYGKRISLVHQKDMAKDTDSPVNVFRKLNREMGEEHGISFAYNRQWVDNDRDFTEIGTGIMDIQEIIDTARESCEAAYIILEQDYTRMPSEIESIQRSMEAFRRYEGISWT